MHCHQYASFSSQLKYCLVHIVTGTLEDWFMLAQQSPGKLCTPGWPTFNLLML
jgi:hypothetical protein